MVGSTNLTLTIQKSVKYRKPDDFFYFPGSMPPNSRTIFDEGAVFMSFKLVDGGIFQEEGIFSHKNSVLHDGFVYN